MKRYWPLLAIVLVLAAIIGMSQYAESAKKHYESAATEAKAATVATDDSTKESYKPPVWAIYVTFPEGIGAWAIILTLLAIAWQSIETRTAAEAALKQAVMQRESLRPRLNISNILNNVYQEAALGQRVCIAVEVSNSGGVPAYGVITETWLEFIERGSMERPWQFSSKAKYDKSSPINVDTGKPQAFELPFNRCLTDTEIDQMRQAKGTVCFRVRLTYLAFDKQCHFDHAFAMRPSSAEDIAEYTSAN